MADEEEKKPGGNTGLKIAVIVLSVILVVGGSVAGLYFAGVFGDNSKSVMGENGEDGGDKEAAKGPAIYIPFEPPFVVNFSKPGKAKFLQISMQGMTRSPEVPNLVQIHMPAIRNNLVLLFSSQTFEKISTNEGKNELREKALSTIQEILEAETGDPGMEAVYFTSIVMQ